MATLVGKTMVFGIPHELRPIQGIEPDADYWLQFDRGAFANAFVVIEGSLICGNIEIVPNLTDPNRTWHFVPEWRIDK